MDRRTLLQVLTPGVITTIAGCNQNRNENDELEPKLDIFAEIEKVDSQWELTARVRNTYDWDTSIHDVTLVAFSENGEEVCQTHVGDFLRTEGPDRTVTVTCDRFPAIITATAEESPCDGAQIEILYWIGSDEQRGADLPNDVKVWGDTYRECNEPIPPERVLENVSRNDSTGFVDQ